MEIKLMPLGNISDDILSAIARAIKLIYKIDVRVSTPKEIPKEAYNPLRQQYLAVKVIEFLSKNFEENILAVTDKDLYAKDLSFVFGQAQFGGRIAIISIFRLDPMFYKKPFDQKLLIDRAVKEAIHEIGHTLKLDHCPNSKCVMNFSNTIFDVDKKGKNLCNMCKLQLGI
jgi:archaemetzincin